MIMTMTMIPPATPSGLRRANCRNAVSRERCGTSSVLAIAVSTVAIGTPSAVVADARVEPRVAQIHDEVREGEDRDHQHHQRLSHGVVVVGDRRDEELAK